MILTVQNDENWLTQVSEETPIQNRVFAKQVMCSVKNAKNWKEITDSKKAEYDEQYQEWLKEQEEELEDEGIFD